jgi:hypothetical protein
MNSIALVELLLVEFRMPIRVAARSKGMKRLRPFEHWGREFESHSRHGRLCAFILCECCPVCRKRACDRLIPRPNSPTDCVYLLLYFRRWALLEKLPIVQPIKNFPAFYETRSFITMFTRALHWSLSWTRLIQSIPSHPISLRSILILSPPPTSWSS